jgi:hypothetical protein
MRLRLIVICGVCAWDSYHVCTSDGCSRYIPYTSLLESLYDAFSPEVGQLSEKVRPIVGEA